MTRKVNTNKTAIIAWFFGYVIVTYIMLIVIQKRLTDVINFLTILITMDSTKHSIAPARNRRFRVSLVSTLTL